MQDLPRPIRRTYRLNPMLAHLLSRMLATLPRVETLPYMQADYHRVGFEAYIPLIFLSDSRSFVEYGYRCRDVFVYCFI